MAWFFILLIVFIAAVIGAGLTFLWRYISQRKKIEGFRQSLAMTLFLVKMPKYERKDDAKPKDINSEIELMERILSSFLYLEKPGFFQKIFYGPQRVAMEIASEIGGDDIAFYCAVPRYMENGLEKIVQGAYPQAMVEKLPNDYTIFEPKGKVAGAWLALKKQIYFPLSTYKTLSGDPLSTVVNGLSKIRPEEGAAVQIILRPSSFDLKKSSDKLLSKMLEEGKHVKTALRQTGQGAAMEWAGAFYEAAMAPKKDQKEQEKEQQRKSTMPEQSVNKEVVDAIRQKITKPILEANVRLVAVASDEFRAQEIKNHLTAGFGQFASVFNEFHIVNIKKRRLKKFIYNFSFRDFNKKERLLLNLEEIASVFHFPLPYIEQPNIRWAKGREAALPGQTIGTSPVNPKTSVSIPSQTQTNSNQGECLNLIGVGSYRGEEKPIHFVSREDRRRHFYIVGQTGTGKSTLLREMIRQDIENGEGVAVIDPHGELVEHTLANIPKSRVEDVVLFEPFDLQRPCGLNMLEYKTPEQKDFAISEMIIIFTKLFPPEIIGPMFEHYMRNAMLALMADPTTPGTLVEIIKIFTDKDFMEKRIAKVTDPLVRSFWLKEWAGATGQTKSDMLGYVVSKVGRFVENEMMRNIIGQGKSSFDLEEIMDNKKIFLANLSKGQTGELNSSLLGLILVSKMQLAALRRGRVPEAQRNDFYLYIDEFQNFTTDSVATILSEARKYRLNLILAHQFMPQLTKEIRDAVVGNVGSMACYRVGAEDAEFLEKQFEPEFSRFDLLNLDNFQFIAKIMQRNIITSAFKVKALPAKPGNELIVEPLKQLSKLKYAKPKNIVESEIKKRLNLEV